MKREIASTFTLKAYLTFDFLPFGAAFIHLTQIRLTNERKET